MVLIKERFYKFDLYLHDFIFDCIIVTFYVHAINIKSYF